MVRGFRDGELIYINVVICAIYDLKIQTEPTHSMVTEVYEMTNFKAYTFGTRERTRYGPSELWLQLVTWENNPYHFQ